jgi:ribosome biogenesis GTPase
LKGIVAKSTGSWYQVADNNFVLTECRIRGSFRMHGIKSTNPIAVGDEVEYQLEEDKSTGVITKIYDRKNYIIRRSINLSKRSHIIASNIDRAFLICSVMMPRTSTGFIDRFLVTAEAYHIPVTIIFNKIDIYNKEAKEHLNYLTSIYKEIGYECLAVSALNKTDMDQLRENLKGKTSLFSGHSGVGKSTLLNAIDNSLTIKTGAISESHSKGTHTTTFAEMHSLKTGGYVIDTPGVKSFGMIDFKREEVAHCFPEFVRLMNKCKFNNCLHINEPGCAVKDALENNQIAEFRYNNYLNIFESDEVNQEDYE